MTFYIQYNESGDVVATVQSFGKPPKHPRQLVFPEFIKTRGKRVNLEQLELEDIPPRVVVEEIIPEIGILQKIMDGIA